MSQISFKERVKNVAISEAKKYRDVYVNYEYIVCSEIFTQKDFYLLSSEKNNYQHLTGVNALISPASFFDKCIDGTLTEDDFNFDKRGQSVGEVKGTVRRKIKNLPDMMDIMNGKLIVQESFRKNRVTCSFATFDGRCTIGFTYGDKSRPQTLLKGNQIDTTKSGDVSLLLRRSRGEEKFNEMLIGEEKDLLKYQETLSEYLGESLIRQPIDEVEVTEEETS